MHQSGGSTQVEIPDRLGKYRIRRLLGRGGMGIVYEGWDESLDRAVAIKLVSPELCRVPEIYDRFKREARAAARLSHPNIINVFEFVEDPKQPFIVMEFVEGQDLGTYMKVSGSLKPDKALRIIRQAALALQKAASSSLVHRDIKPSNILVTQDGGVKVMDFGLSKLLDSSTNLTTSGALMGTPDYMSPEQARGEKLDFRTDMYSLGCTLYALLAGHRPFDSETMAGLIHKHINESLSIPTGWREYYSGQLVTLLERLTAKKKESRYDAWDEVITAIDAMLSAKPPTQWMTNIPISPRKPFPTAIAATAGLVGMLAIGAGLFALLKEEEPQPMSFSTSTYEAAPIREDAPSVGAVRVRPTAAPPPATNISPPVDRARAATEDRTESRGEALAALAAGNFPETRRIIEEQADSAQLPAVRGFHQSMLEMLSVLEAFDAKLAQRAGRQGASREERLNALHAWIDSGTLIDPQDINLAMFYMRALRDAESHERNRQLIEANPSILQSQSHHNGMRLIDTFFGDMTGPQGPQGGLQPGGRGPQGPGGARRPMQRQ